MNTRDAMMAVTVREEFFSKLHAAIMVHDATMERFADYALSGKKQKPADLYSQKQELDRARQAVIKAARIVVTGAVEPPSKD